MRDYGSSHAYNQSYDLRGRMNGGSNGPPTPLPLPGRQGPPSARNRGLLPREMCFMEGCGKWETLRCHYCQAPYCSADCFVVDWSIHHQDVCEIRR